VTSVVSGGGGVTGFGWSSTIPIFVLEVESNNPLHPRSHVDYPGGAMSGSGATPDGGTVKSIWVCIRPEDIPASLARVSQLAVTAATETPDSEAATSTSQAVTSTTAAAAPTTEAAAATTEVAVATTEEATPTTEAAVGTEPSTGTTTPASEPPVETPPAGTGV
jgi:hypothetical protein